MEKRDDAARIGAERGLHIGGKVRAKGWEVMDANPNEWVDHVGDAAGRGFRPVREHQPHALSPRADQCKSGWREAGAGIAHPACAAIAIP